MYMRPCRVEIDTRALEDNVKVLKRLAGPEVELLAVVKANAYGHGLELCAPAAVRAGCRWLGVTSVDEGVAARAVAPEARILVISGAFAGEGRVVVEQRLTPVVWETWQLDELEQAAAGLPAGSLDVHLEIDTGMSRQGVDGTTLPLLLSRFKPGSPLRLAGVMTHLFAADESDGVVTDQQLARMDYALGRISAAGHLPEWLNVGNSAALVNGQAARLVDLAARHGLKAMLRPGFALYGLVPEFAPDQPQAVREAAAALRPVLEWKTAVVTVRSVEAGAVIGYNGTFVATEPMRIALLAVGYADGLDRLLGNRFHVLVGGEQAPIVGRISMDQVMVDVTEIEGVAPGDEAVLIGRQGERSITAYDHAHVSSTIAWEVFTRIGPRVHRVAR